MGFDALLEDVLTSSTPTEQGRRFESFVVWVLSNAHPYKGLFSRVWTWDEWPGRDGSDIGIDIVAKRRDGSGLWAVQAKGFSESASITKRSIDAFLAASPTDTFSYRLLVASTDHVGLNARRAIDAQSAGLLLRDQLSRLPVEWPNTLDQLLHGPERVTSQISPLPHQLVAVSDARAGLRRSDRGQVIMPCGTGKTLVGLWLAERLKARRVVFLAPSLALVRQTLEAWTSVATHSFDWIAVCSDQTVAGDSPSRGSDDSLEMVADLGLSVTTDPADIASFLSGKGRRIIFSTYQSSSRIADAFRQHDLPEFDLAVCDEAHRLTGILERGHRAILDARAIPCRRRVFMTATPRVYSTQVKTQARAAELSIASMDDKRVFGPVVHELSFAKAIDDGLLADYRVVVLGVLDDDYASALLDEGRLLHVDDTDLLVDARTLAAAVALGKTMRRYGLQRTISFHSSIKRAKQFRSVVPFLFARLQSRSRPGGILDVRHVNGEMTTAERTHVLGLLRRLDHCDRMLVTNARCLSEGIDVPSLDSLVFADPRRSRIEVVQAVGRAIRLADEKVGTIILPVSVASHEDPDSTLRSSEFDTVWQVLSALRSHDGRLGEEIDALAVRHGREGVIGRLPPRIVLSIPGSHISIRRFEEAFTARAIELTGDPFSQGLGIATAWTDAFGSLASVKINTVHRGFPIGRWLHARRSEHRRGELSPQRTEALEQLGVVWEPFEWRWLQGLEACRAWVEEHGSLSSVVQSTQYESFPLGVWLAVRRTEFRRGALSKSRAKTLESLGMVWDVRESQWLEGLTVAREWSKERGSLTPGPRVVYRGFRLGQWLRERRAEYQHDRMPPERQVALEALGIIWKPRDQSWLQGLRACRGWVAVNGSLASVTESSMHDGFPIGTWLSGRRAAYMDGRLPVDQASTLEGLGLVWDPREALWERGIKACEEWVEENGSLAFVSATVVVDGFQLGRWLARRAHQYRKGTLPPDRAKVLEDLGIVWGQIENLWLQGLAACAGWVSEHGSLASVKVDSVHEGFPLGRWIDGRRLAYRRGKLPEERIAALEDLGVLWYPRDPQWALALQKCQRWAKQHGSLASVLQSTKFEGFKLGAWITHIRGRYRRGSLPRDRIVALEDLGIVWDPLGKRWADSIAVCEAWVEEHDSLRAVRGRIVYRGFPLGAWLEARRREYRKGKVPPERVQALEKLGFNWTPAPRGRNSSRKS